MFMISQGNMMYIFIGAFLMAILIFYSNSNLFFHRTSSLIQPNFIRYQNENSEIFKIEKIVEKIPCPHIDTTVTHNLCEYQAKIKYNLGIFDESFMSKESLHVARLYINTVKYSVLNLFYVHFDGIIDGRNWPPQGACQALTMSGLRRLDNLQMVLEDVILRQIDGDFIELGVWKGGICIFAKAIKLLTYLNIRSIRITSAAINTKFCDPRLLVE